MFDLSMDYDEDDQVLLDWEQYAGLKRTRCCGMDCTRLVNRLPFSNSFPPAWWYQLTNRQKRLFWYLVAGFTAFIIILTISLSSSGNHSARNAPNSGAAQEFLSQYSSCQWDQWRLPNSTTPTAYDLSLVVDLEEPYTVAGTVKIQLNMTEQSPCVVLHSSGMTVGQVSLEGRSTVGETSSCAAPVHSLCIRSDTTSRSAVYTYHARVSSPVLMCVYNAVKPSGQQGVLHLTTWCTVYAFHTPHILPVQTAQCSWVSYHQAFMFTLQHAAVLGTL